MSESPTTPSGRRRFALLVLSAAALCACELDQGSPHGSDDRGFDDAGQEHAAGDASTDAALAEGAPLPLPAISFERYHSQSQIADYLRAVAEARPKTVTFEVLGTSEEGREISHVVIDATGLARAPAVFINGTHHGDEPSSTESSLALLDHLLRESEAPEVRQVLSAYAIDVLPLVNPDGHFHRTREDSLGRDPNRDYASPARDGAQSFQLAEIKLVRELQDRSRFRGAVAYHSGIEEVIWPWGYAASPADHEDALYAVSKAACEAMGFDRYMQSYDDYPTQGEYIDYAYWKHGTLAITMEVSTDKAPPRTQLASIVGRSVQGTFAYLKALHALDRGAMTLLRASPHWGHLAPRIVNQQKLE